MSKVGNIKKLSNTPSLNFYEFEAIHRDGTVNKHPYYVASRAKKIEDLKPQAEDNTVLEDDLATVGDEVFFKAANMLFSYLGTDSVIRDITKLGTSVFGGVSAPEYFLLALVSPLISAFVADDDGVDDNNGTIPGYGTVDTQSRISNVFENIIDIFKDVITAFVDMVTILSKIFIA